MMNENFNENEAMRYFLGELSETELSAVEERFFADEEFSLFLDEVETDLIDSYIRNELNVSQKRKFEEKFLISERRRERVKAAAVLMEKEKSLAPVAVLEAAKPSFLQSLKGFFSVPNLGYASLGVLLLALVGGLIWFLKRPSEIVKIGNEDVQVPPTILPLSNILPEISPTSTLITNTSPKTNSSPSEPKKTPAPVEKKGEPKTETSPKPRQPLFALARLNLFSVSSRAGGGETNKITLKPEIGSVFLSLRFRTEEEFVKFRMEMRDAGGNLISSRNVENKNSLNLTIPAKNLRQGIYKITLKGAKAEQDFEDLDFYELIVEKQ
jgi:hypothetical protein